MSITIEIAETTTTAFVAGLYFGANEAREDCFPWGFLGYT